MTSFTTNPIVGWPMLIVVTVCLLIFFRLRPDYASATPKRRQLLYGMRLLLTLLVALMMVRPGCRRTVERAQSATVIFLCDTSRSMHLPHEAAGLSRWEKLERTLGENRDTLQRLANRLDVKFYGFDGRTAPVEIQNGEALLPRQPEGGQTDLGTAINDGLAPHQSQRIAAVYLLSDGTQNADDPQIEITDAVAKLDQNQVPLYTVGFGQPSDAGQAADVSIVGLADQFSIFVKNRLGVQASVRLNGFANQQVPVQLIVTDSSGNEEIVDTQIVETQKNDQVIPVTLVYSPQEPGEYVLSVRAEQMPSELVTRNNELPAFLSVREGGLRVLYLEGDIRLEQTFLRRSLAESPDIEVDFQLLDKRNRDRWPLDLSALFDDPTYDVFILGDVDSRALYQQRQPVDSLSPLFEAVANRNKGLLFLGGYQSFGPGRYHSTPIADLFPIEMRKYEAQDFNQEINHELHISYPLSMKPVGRHFITNLLPGSENEAIWESLPPLLGANKFFGVKDRSLVIAEGQGKVPLLVTGSVGGRVVAFAGDSTWQWWTSGQQEAHKRFWRQVILWLARLDGQADQDISIDMPQRRFSPNTPVPFSVQVKSRDGAAIEDVQLTTSLLAPDGSRTPLPSRIVSEIADDEIEKNQTIEPGTYTLEVIAEKDGVGIGSATRDFIVFDEDLEQANPAADPELLALMSSQTSAWGGRLLDPEDLSKHLKELEEQPLDLVIEVPEKWELGSTAADALGFIVCFAGILGIEWFLRKRWGMA